MGPNYNRVNKVKPFLRYFNFKNINYPLKKKIMKPLKEIMNQFI